MGIAETANRPEFLELSHASSCFVASAILAAVGLAGSTYAGFFARQGIDTQLITPVLVAYFAATYGIAAAVNRKALAWLASGVMFLAIVHALALNDWTREHWFHFSFVHDHPVVAAAVLHSLFAVGIAAGMAWRRRAEEKVADALAERKASYAVAGIYGSVLLVGAGVVGGIAAVCDLGYSASLRNARRVCGVDRGRLVGGRVASAPGFSIGCCSSAGDVGGGVFCYRILLATVVVERVVVLILVFCRRNLSFWRFGARWRVCYDSSSRRLWSIGLRVGLSDRQWLSLLLHAGDFGESAEANSLADRRSGRFWRNCAGLLRDGFSGLLCRNYC